MKPCVCLMNDSFPPMIDGVATAVLQYAKILSATGQAVVATPEYPSVDDSIYPFPVIRYPSINTTKIVGYRAGLPFHAPSLRALEQYPIDLIHSHCPFISTYLARVLRQSRPVPVVFTYHTKFDIEITRAVHEGALQKTATKLMIDNISACDEVWVVSRGAGENLRSMGYEGDCHLMENGVDFPRGKAPKEAVLSLCRTLYQTYGLRTDDGVPRFLFVGRMMWYKGIRLILDALAALRDEGLRFHMIFIGDGMDCADIKAYTAKLRLEPFCIFTGAIHDRALLRAYYSICTVFLFPSTFDTNGIVVREAAACALPSMLIRGSCAAEGIVDGQTGFLVEENAGSIAGFLRHAIRQPSMCTAVGTRAMQEIYISWEDAVHRAAQRYEIVCERYRSGEKKTPEPVSDEIFSHISTVLETINTLHAATKAIKCRAGSSLRYTHSITRENGAKLREYSKEILLYVDSLCGEAEALFRESMRETGHTTKAAYARAKRLLAEAETILRCSGSALDTQAEDFLVRSQAIKQAVKRLFEDDTD